MRGGGRLRVVMPGEKEAGEGAFAALSPHPGRRYDSGRPASMAAAMIGPAASAAGSPQQSTAGRSLSMFEGGSGSAAGATVVATVKWYDPVKGFGFLAPADGSRDLFCHVSAVSGAGLLTLPEGATVTCEVEQGPRGAAGVADPRRGRPARFHRSGNERRAEAPAARP